MLSISFLSESDSIHRNTKIAGDTITNDREPQADAVDARA